MSRKSVFLPACCLLAMSALGFYGVTVDPKRPETFCRSCMVPKNFLVYEMTQPDGVKRTFQRDYEDPTVLMGTSPWFGKIRGDGITVMTDPGFKGGRTGFMFHEGMLKLMLLDGREYKIPPGLGGGPVSDVGSLWKREQLIAEMETGEEYRIWRRGDRLRLWFENPNKAGAFLAGTALLSLFMCMSGSRALKITGAVSSVFFFIGVVLTSSRGAMLGCLAGFSVFLLSLAGKYFTLKRLLLLFAVIVAMAGVVYILQGERLTSGFFTEAKDDSTSRLPIWKEVPSMMVSSPGGWGLGMSGDAYVNWFQPLERYHTPRTLINSHFTWLVEFSWAWRYLYVFAWLTLLGTLLCVAVKGGGAVALAVWVSAGISAFFNAVLEDWAVWVPLALALACSLPSVRKACSLKIFAGTALLAASVSALLPVGAFFLAKGGDNAVPVCYDGARVEINGKNPSVWVVDDQWAFCGGYGGMLGKEIRTYFLDNPESGALGYTRDIAHLPGKIDRLALIGKSGEAFYRRWKENPSALPQADEVVFFSPPFSASRIPAEFRRRFATTVVHGGMTGLVARNSDPIPDWVRIVPGAELYIPGWLDAVLGDR